MTSVFATLQESDLPVRTAVTRPEIDPMVWQWVSVISMSGPVPGFVLQQLQRLLRESKLARKCFCSFCERAFIAAVEDSDFGVDTDKVKEIFE